MIEDNLIKLLANYLSVEEEDLSSYTNIYNEFNLTDADIEELIGIIEDEFEISINRDDFDSVSTIRELSELVEDSI